MSDCTDYFADSFNVINLPRLVQRFLLWRTHLPMVKPYYAAKTNPNPHILRTLAALGAGFDCASMKEQELAVTALREVADWSRKDASGRARPLLAEGEAADEHIVYANPMKQMSHIWAAEHRWGVHLTVVDSVSEVDKLASLDYGGAVLVRIITDDSGASSQLSLKYGATLQRDLTGSQGGASVPRHSAEEILSHAVAKGVPVRGVSFHVGSGHASEAACAKAYRLALRDARELFCYAYAQHAGSPHAQLDTLDIGGGFPGSDTPGTLTFAGIATVVARQLKALWGHEEPTPGPSALEWRAATPHADWCAESEYPSVGAPGRRPPKPLRVFAEPGRFFAEQTQTLAVNVIGKKEFDLPYGPMEREMAFWERPSNVHRTQHNMLYVNDGLYGSLNNVVMDGKRIDFSLTPSAEKRLRDAAPPVPNALGAGPVAPGRRGSVPHDICWTTIWGPTCDSLDKITNNAYVDEHPTAVQMPCGVDLRDWLYTTNQGAYTDSGASDFNGALRAVLTLGRVWEAAGGCGGGCGILRLRGAPAARRGADGVRCSLGAQVCGKQAARTTR